MTAASGHADRPGPVWIQGAGEMASGVAVRLFRCGYRIVMAEVPRPRAVRRLVVFCDAVFSGSALVEGVPGRLCRSDALPAGADEVAVVIDPDGDAIIETAPAAVIDARMTKRPPRPLPVGPAAVIGLGPGFRCGRDAALIVETHRDARLGAVLDTGQALPATGVPGAIDGHTTQRVLRAPRAGHLEPRRRIGDLVRAGQIVGEIAGAPVVSALDGLLRGLIHPDTELSVGDKVGDVDPRGSAVDPTLVSDKALAVAGGALEALLRLGITPC